jgi:hypothetical protein
VPSRTKLLLLSDFFEKFSDHFASELDQFVAFGAVEMVVLRVTIVVLVNAAAVQLETSQEPCVNKFFQSPINSGPRYVVQTPLAWKLVHQLVSVEMLMVAKDSFDQKTPLLGVSLASALKVLFESLDWRHRNGHAS